VTRTIFYTYMRTERSAAASEYRTRNLAVTSPILLRTSLVMSSLTRDQTFCKI